MPNPKRRKLKLSIKGRAMAAKRHLKRADTSMTLLYMRLCRQKSPAADAFLILLGDWRESTTRMQMLLSNY